MPLSKGNPLEERFEGKGYPGDAARRVLFSAPESKGNQLSKQLPSGNGFLYSFLNMCSSLSAWGCVQPAGLRAREEPWPPAAAAWRGSGPSPPSWLLKSRIHIPEELRRHGEPPVSPPQILFPDASRFHTDLPSPSRGFTGSAPGVVLTVPSACGQTLLLLGGAFVPKPPLGRFGSSSPWSGTPGKLLLRFPHLFCCWNKGLVQVPRFKPRLFFLPARQALLSPFSAFSDKDGSVTSVG